MEAEEMFNFTLGDNMECAGCKELQKIIDKHKEEKQLSFKTLKQKIISTDQLIKQYNAKREEYDQQSKMLEDVTRKLERSKRDTEMLEGQLQSALQQLEPLKKDIQSLNVTLKRKDTEIEMLNDKLKAADMLQAQFEAAARAHQAERSQIDRSDKEKKTLNKRIESLETTKEKLEKDVCKFKEANKLLKSENKTLQKNLDKALKTSSNMVFLGGSPSKATRGRKKGLPESPLCKEKLPFSCASGTENELSDAVGIMDAGSSSEDEINFDVDFALSPLSNLLSPLPPTPHDLTVQEEGVIQGKTLQKLSDGLERLSDSESGEEDDEAIDEGAAALEELITDLLPNTDENVKLKSVACVESMTEITSEGEEMAKKSNSHLNSENIAAENEKIVQEKPNQIPSNKINGEPIFLDGVPLMKENGLVEKEDKPKTLQALPNQMSMDHSLDDVSLPTESEDKVKTLQAHLIQITSDKSISDDERFEINKNKTSKNHIKCSPPSVENNQMSKSQNVYSVEETGCDLNVQKSPEILNKYESPHRANTSSVSVHLSSSTSLLETKQAVAKQVEDTSHSGVNITPDCSSSRVDIASDLTLPTRESPDSTTSELVLTLVSSKREEIRIKNEEDDRRTLDLPKSEAVFDHNMVTEIGTNKELVSNKINEIISIVPDKEKEIISVVPNKENEIVPNMEIEIVPKKENETDPKKEYETVSIVQNKKTEIVLKMENMVNEPESFSKEILSYSKALSINAGEKTQLKSSPTCSHTSGFYLENVAANGDNVISHSSNRAKTLTQENSSLEVNENISSDVTIKETSVNGSSRADSHGTFQGSENIATKDSDRLVPKSEKSSNERTSDPPEMNKNKCSVDTNEFQKSMNEKLAHPPNSTQNKEPVRTDLRGDDACYSSVVCKEIVNNDYGNSNINEGMNSPRSVLKTSKSHVDHGETNIEETKKSQPFKADIERIIGETGESFDNNESKTEMIEDRNSSKMKDSKPEVPEIVEDNKLKRESLEKESRYPEHVKKEVVPPLAAENSNSENMIHKSINHMHDVNTQLTTDNSTSYHCEDIESTIDKSDLLTGESLDKSGSGGSMLNFEIKPETNVLLPKTSDEQKVEKICDEENENDPNKGNALCPNIETEIVETPPNIKIETVQKMNNEIVSKMDKVIVSNMENEIIRNNKIEIALTIHEECEVIIGMKNDNNQVTHQDEKSNEEKLEKKDQNPKSVCLPLENNNCPKLTKDISLPDDTATTAKSLDITLLVDHLVNDKSLSQPQQDPTATTFEKKTLNTEEKYPATASNDLKDPKGSEIVASSKTKIVEIFSLKKEASDLENISEKVMEMNGFENTDSKLDQQTSIHQDSVPVPKMNGPQDTILQEISTFKPTNFQAENSDLNPNTGKMPLKNISDSNSASCTSAEHSGLDKVMVSTILSRNIIDSEKCRELNQAATDHLIQKDQEKKNGFNNSSSTNQLTSESEDLMATPHDFEIKPKWEPAVDQQEISRKAEKTTQIGNIRLCRRIAHVKKDANEPKDNNLHPHDQSLSDSFDTDNIGRRKTRKAKKRKRKDVKKEMTHKSPKSENIIERGFNSDVNIDQTDIEDINSEKQASADSTDQLDKGFGKKPVMVTQKSTGFLMSGADLLTNATKKHSDSKTGKQNLCKNNNKSRIYGSSGFPQIDVELPNTSKSCSDTKIKLASLPSTSKDSVDLAEEFSSMDDFFGIFTLPASPFDMLDMLKPISPLPPSPDITNTQVMDDICLTSFCEELDVNKSITLNDAEVQMLPSFSDTNANSSIIKPSPIHPLATSATSKTFPKESPQNSVKAGKIFLTTSDQESVPQSSISLNYKVCLKSTEKETAKEVLSEHSPLTLQTQLNSCVHPSSQKDMKNLDDSITSGSELPGSAAGNKMLSNNTPFRMMTRRKSQLSSQIELKKATSTVNIKVDEPKTDESDVMLLSCKRTADSGKNNYINEPKTDAGKDHRVSVLSIQKHVSNFIESNVIATSDGSHKCGKGSSINSAPGHPGQVHKVSDGSATTGPMNSNSPNKYKQVICLSNTEVCELSQNRFSKRKIIDVSVDGVAGPSSKSVVEVSAAAEPTPSDSKNKKVSKRKVTEDPSDNLSKKPKTETPQNDSCMDEASASSGINPHSLREDLVHMVKNGDIIAFLDKYFSNDEERTCSWRKVMLLIHEYLKDNKEMVSYENVSDKNRINMLDSEERICVLMNKITTNFQECGLDMLLDILWTSSTEDGIQMPSELSMMRMYTAICRLKGNVELARVLLYHIMINVTDKNRLMNQILAIVGVWPLVLEKDYPKGSIMAQTLQHAILKLRVKLDTDGTKLLMKICAICNWPSDLPLNDNMRVQEKIIQYLKDHNNERERLYEGTSSLKLLLLGEEWIFIFREFIQRHVSSVCQRWTSKSGQGSDVVYVESILSVLADILIPCINPDFQHIKMILQTYLAPALNTITPMTCVTDCIAHAIMKLSPFAPQVSMVTLLKWFKKHKAVLPGPLKAQLQQTRNMLMEHFPNFKCGDFV